MSVVKLRSATFRSPPPGLLRQPLPYSVTCSSVIDEFFASTLPRPAVSWTGLQEKDFSFCPQKPQFLKQQDFLGVVFYSPFLLSPFALPQEGRRKLVPSSLSGLISGDLLLEPSSWRDKERKGFASLLIRWPGLLVYRTNLLRPCRTQSPDSNQKLWRSREVVLNTRVETPLVFKWFFHRGHLRLSKDTEICVTIHNSSKILVMK